MPFTFVPIEAARIDVSSITDVERERLKVTFTHGEELYFRVDLRNGRQHPRLLLDLASDQFGHELGTNRELHKEFAWKFYEERVYRSPAKKFVDWLHKLAKESFNATFAGWTYRRVYDELEIEVSMGSEHQACELAIGRSPEFSFGTYHTRMTDYLPFTWGDIVSIESIMLAPISLATAAIAAP